MEPKETTLLLAVENEPANANATTFSVFLTLTMSAVGAGCMALPYTLGWKNIIRSFLAHNICGVRGACLCQWSIFLFYFSGCGLCHGCGVINVFCSHFRVSLLLSCLLFASLLLFFLRFSSLPFFFQKNSARVWFFRRLSLIGLAQLSRRTGKNDYSEIADVVLGPIGTLHFLYSFFLIPCHYLSFALLVPCGLSVSPLFPWRLGRFFAILGICLLLVGPSYVTVLWFVVVVLYCIVW